MSNIIVSIPGIEGEAQGDHAGGIQCDTMRHAIDLPVFPGTVRVEGTSNHGAVGLTHTVDKASPPLRMAVSTGIDLGSVVIKVQRMVEGAMQVVEEITLDGARVVRIDLDTPLDGASMEPQDAPVETFYLEYSKISWTANKFASGQSAGSVATAYDVIGQTSVA